MGGRSALEGASPRLSETGSLCEWPSTRGWPSTFAVRSAPTAAHAREASGVSFLSARWQLRRHMHCASPHLQHGSFVAPQNLERGAVSEAPTRPIFFEAARDSTCRNAGPVMVRARVRGARICFILCAQKITFHLVQSVDGFLCSTPPCGGRLRLCGRGRSNGDDYKPSYVKM